MFQVGDILVASAPMVWHVDFYQVNGFTPSGNLRLVKLQKNTRDLGGSPADHTFQYWPTIPDPLAAPQGPEQIARWSNAVSLFRIPHGELHLHLDIYNPNQEYKITHYL